MPDARRLVRAAVPSAVRWRVRLARRLLHDLVDGARFATRRGEAAAFPHLVCRYELTLPCYPGQEGHFAGKRHNIALSLASAERIVVGPGEMFSFWRCAGRPTVRAGYQRAAALKDRVLTHDVGGAICFSSTLLYNAGLLGGFEIVERRCHSVDSYGDARYFELGRDAAVEYAYIDLRFRNVLPAPLLLRARLDGATAVAEVWSREPLALAVIVEAIGPAVIEPPVLVRRDASVAPGAVAVDDPGLPGIAVRTRRTVTFDGRTRCDDLGVSVDHARPRRERHGPEPDAG